MSEKNGADENRSRRYRQIGGLLLAVVCLALLKWNVWPVASAKVDDWSAGNQTIVYNEQGYMGGYRAVLSPDQRAMAFCKGGREFYSKDLQSGTLTTHAAVGRIYGLKYSPNGEWLAAGQNLWNSATGQQAVLPTAEPIGTTFDQLAFSADSKLLATVNSTKAVIEVWDVATQELRQTLAVQEYYLKKRGLGSPVREMSFSPDGRYLAVAGSQITIWDLQSGGCVNAFGAAEQHSQMNAVRYSPDGRWLAVIVETSAEKTAERPKNDANQWKVLVFDAASGQIEKTLPYPQHLSRIAYSPDGKCLAVGWSIGRDDRLRKIAELIDGETGAVVQELSGFPASFADDIGFSADGTAVFVSDSECLKIWRRK